MTSNEGVKVVLSLTIVLSMYVLQTMLATVIPDVDENEMPPILRAMVTGFILSIVSLAESVFVLTVRFLPPGFPTCVNRFALFMFEESGRCSNRV